ncbi:MAG: PAS domain S-box protein, partial [Candidatus Methanoperedens sp.]|nr:PAS domain S-box protein [Candidatus Methanoperedens sp.]
KSGATDYVLKDRLSRLVPAVDRALSEAKEKIGYRKARKALEESELKFRSVVQSANDAIILTDGKNDIIFWNKGAQAIFG